MKLIEFLKHSRVLWLLLAVAFLLRLGVALPGLLAASPEERFSRPDTVGYLEPARALAAEGRYLDRPGGEADFSRAPGFAFAASLVFRICGTGSVVPLVVVLILANTAAVGMIYWCGKVWHGERAGLIAAAFAALNLTMIAQAPMLLSDTLFTLCAAGMLGCFGLFYHTRRYGWFLAALATAALGALVRPINSVWFLPAIFLLLMLPGKVPNWRSKVSWAVAGALLFGAILLPWMARNARLGAGYVIDSNTGAMYHQNGAMILARVNRSSYEAEKQTILSRLEAEFADRETYPDVKSQSAYRMRKFRELIAAHPFIWISQHFRPQILLPDAPTFFEILGVTQAGQGTMDVLHSEGILAAVRHYFGGKIWVLFTVLPLLALTAVMYMLALWQLVDWLWHWRCDWYWLLLFLAFAEYFFFLPGPITAPRYQLPALPFLTLMAAMKLVELWTAWRGKPVAGELTTPPA